MNTSSSKAEGCPPLGPVDRAAYHQGRSLVVRHGLRLEHLLFDADEVLWDWVMDFSEVIRGARWRCDAGHFDMSHREWIRVRPGVMGLLWGLHHGCEERGLDARLRIWTNGYPYRLRAIIRHIPGFFVLLGLPDDREDTLARAPNVFFRRDYSSALEALFEPLGREAWLATAALAVRRVVERHLTRRPLDPNLKLPALASLVGKPDLAEARVLVDDTMGNVRRFVRAGGCAVHVAAPAPSVIGGGIPNTVWHNGPKHLWGLVSAFVPDLGEALERLAPLARPFSGQTDRGAPENPRGVSGCCSPSWIRIHRRPAGGAQEGAGGAIFVIRIPDAPVRQQWLGARARLRALFEDRAAHRELLAALRAS